MKFFAKITQDYWTLKNNVQKQAMEVARFMDRKLLDGEVEKAAYIRLMNERIKLVNAENPRCHPLILSTWRNPIDKRWNDTYVQISGVFSIIIYEVHEVR